MGKIPCASLSARRAWIEIMIITESYNFKRSLSARRAWIEIVVGAGQQRGLRVALRKESVDRNKGSSLSSNLLYQSLSARRAWIEISVHHRAGPQK